MTGRQHGLLVAALTGLVPLLSVPARAADGAAAGNLPMNDSREFWGAIRFGEQKIGHVHHEFAGDPAGAGLLNSRSYTTLSFLRGGVRLDFDESAAVEEEATGAIRRYRYRLTSFSNGQCMTSAAIDGERRDGRLHVVSNGYEHETAYEPLARGPWFMFRRLLAERPRGPGHRFQEFAFVPEVGRGVRVTVEIGPEERVSVGAGDRQLQRVMQTLEIRPLHPEVQWLDAEGQVLLREVDVPVLGKVRIVQCGKDEAQAPATPVELMTAASIPSPIALPGARSVRTARYRVRYAPGTRNRLYAGERQTVRPLEDGLAEITVDSPRPDADLPAYRKPFPQDPGLAEYLQPTAFIEADQPLIRDMAQEAVGDAADAVDAARRIERYVRGKIQNKTMDMGFATALETARTLRGDCSEHGVLAAALARAVGIPSRIVVGVVYVADGSPAAARHPAGNFVFHVWTELRVGPDLWLPVDAALGGFDATHVALTKSALATAAPLVDLCLPVLEIVDSLRLEAVEVLDPAPPAAAPLRGLFYNQDCTDFFFTQPPITPEADAGAVLDRYVDLLADAGVTVAFCNTNARKTNYRSQVWEAFWDGYDPDGPDDQPFLAPLATAEVASYRRLVGNMLALDRQGVDYPSRFLGRCRARGVSPWISLRMNDVHFNDNLNHPFHGALWRNPAYFRRNDPGYFARGLDYAHPEVRDLYRALVVETLDRFDLDGLDLDFMREPYVFSRGEEDAGRPVLTEWLRGVRQLCREASARRGHTIRLGVRVPSNPDTAFRLGLDAVTWAQEGLVDLVVATPRWATLEFDMALREWRERLHAPAVTLAGGLEIRLQPWAGGPAQTLTPEHAAGAAGAVLTAGADAVYLFNYFPGVWTPAVHRDTLQAMASLPDLLQRPRRHAVTFRDIVAPGEDYRPPLPATGARLVFRLPTGPAPRADQAAVVEVGLADAPAADPATVQVKVNGQACGVRNARVGTAGIRILAYTIPAGALSGLPRDEIEVIGAAGQSLKVVQVEVWIGSGE